MMCEYNNFISPRYFSNRGEGNFTHDYRYGYSKLILKTAPEIPRSLMVQSNQSKSKCQFVYRRFNEVPKGAYYQRLIMTGIVGKCLLGLRRQEAYERRLRNILYIMLANQSVALAKF